ncbi:MAG: GIDE domain-containing protein, partial [Pseudanabaena sp.]
RYTESIFPFEREVLVICTAADDGGQLTLRKPIQTDKKFIISLKSEEELAKSTANAAQSFFYGMIGSLSAGLILVILGLILKR